MIINRKAGEIMVINDRVQAEVDHTLGGDKVITLKPTTARKVIQLTGPELVSLVTWAEGK